MIHDQVYTYFDENNILFKQQYGFRSGKGTSHAIYSMYYKFYMNIGIISYIQDASRFSRAFETIDHEILLQKLEAYDLKRAPLNCLRKYITTRKQTTEVNNFISRKEMVQLWYSSRICVRTTDLYNIRQ